MRADDVYVLGAGASYVHGAPLTDQLLPYALDIAAGRGDPRLLLVRKFLQDVFHFTPPSGRVQRPRPGRGADLTTTKAWKARWSGVPGLVDVLSILDVALDRKESLARRYDVEMLRRVRHALEYAIFEALEDSLRWKRRRSRATHELASRLDPERSAVISFNYDVIADIALATRGRNADSGAADLEALSGSDYQAIDYGVEFSNVPPGPAGRFQLLKLHGSFNWLRSRLTGNLYFGGMLKAARLVFKDARDSAADLRRYFRAKTGPGQVAEVVDDLEAVLITPTHLKDLRNAHVARIWRTAEERLREARRITFIGYSLPGDDLHVKYLFKRALETRPAGTPPPRIVVVDKGNQRTSEVRRNYERFFGSRIVRFHGDGFDEWLATHGPAPARAGRNARPVERRR